LRREKNNGLGILISEMRTGHHRSLSRIPGFPKKRARETYLWNWTRIAFGRLRFLEVLGAIRQAVLENLNLKADGRQIRKAISGW
jgi:hypothetical protein